MKTTTVETAAGKIVCHESSGTGQAIVLVHGNSASSAAFARQMEGALGARYRLIAFDLPGHGASDDAADPTATYNMPGYARVLLAVTFDDHRINRGDTRLIERIPYPDRCQQVMRHMIEREHAHIPLCILRMARCRAAPGRSQQGDTHS